MKKVLFVIAFSLIISTAAFAAHSANLTYTASVSAGVTGYNVYRGTAAGGENYLTPVNATLVTGVSFTDTTVVASQLYFYTVKAYCPTCNPTLSIASNEVSVTIPADQPAPPTGVNLVAQ